MPEALKPEEVDALLNLVEQRGRDPSASPDLLPGGGRPHAGYRVMSAADVKPHDFRRPERVSTEQLAALKALHEVFARNLSASFAGCLRTAVEVKLISVEQFTYSEFTMSLPSPTSISLLSCKPLEGNWILEINPSITFPMIDRLLGGGPSRASPLDRPFTSIEQRLVSFILKRILDQLTETWQSLRAIRFRIVESESNPFLMHVLAPSEVIVLLSFEVSMGQVSMGQASTGQHSGMLNLCIPYKAIESLLQEFSRSRSSSRSEPRARSREEQVLASIGGAEVEVTAILAEVQLRLADLLTLRPGDIIDTAKRADGELVLTVEGQRAFLGRACTSRGKLALRITRRGSGIPGAGAPQEANPDKSRR